MKAFKDLKVGDKIECHRNWADDKYNGLVATIEVKNFLTREDGILINYKQVTSNLIGRYMSSDFKIPHDLNESVYDYKGDFKGRRGPYKLMLKDA